jgi:hypothetical protein
MKKFIIMIIKLFLSDKEGYVPNKHTDKARKEHRLVQSGPFLMLPQCSMIHAALPEGLSTVIEREYTRIRDETGRGCGLYFELGVPEMILKLRALRAELCVCNADIEVFERTAGEYIDDHAYQRAVAFRKQLQAEILREYI